MKKDLKSKIESLLLVTEVPIDLKELSRHLGINIALVKSEIEALTEEYKSRGIRIIKKGEQYVFGTAPENTNLVKTYLNEELRQELTSPSLEVLAIIIYKQPVTRAEIEEIRGADSSRNIRILLMRGLIEERGRKDTPGRPILYGTTLKLLTHFGLENESDLPKLELEFELKS
ncbi:MAG: SMC-Scp complex subunit ScpB [Bacteriovoracaceae bacterium]